MDPYERLGVRPGATIDEAEDAYHHLLRRHHPDLHHAGSPDEIAEAERLTRELNHAIDQIRAGTATVGASTASSFWRPSARPTVPTDARSWEEDAPGEAPRREAPPHEAPPGTVCCPLCGTWFATGHDLRAHVRHAHDLRLEPERRPSRFRRWYLRSPLAGLGHVSIWFVLPFNAVLALMAAVLVANNVDTQAGYWVFAVGMSPTIIRLVDQTDGDF